MFSINIPSKVFHDKYHPARSFRTSMSGYREQDRMVYTVKNRCLEAPDMAYEDGAENLFLYCEGEGEGVSEELRDLLRYMVSSRLVSLVKEGTISIAHAAAQL